MRIAGMGMQINRNNAGRMATARTVSRSEESATPAITPAAVVDLSPEAHEISTALEARWHKHYQGPHSIGQQLEGREHQPVPATAERGVPISQPSGLPILQSDNLSGRPSPPLLWTNDPADPQTSLHTGQGLEPNKDNLLAQS